MNISDVMERFSINVKAYIKGSVRIQWAIIGPQMKD